jgi:hypothetical protein
VADVCITEFTDPGCPGAAEFTDPGCPWAWTAEPFRRRLTGLYGVRTPPD